MPGLLIQYFGCGGGWGDKDPLILARAVGVAVGQLATMLVATISAIIVELGLGQSLTLKSLSTTAHHHPPLHLLLDKLRKLKFGTHTH